jgi:hypothetical protein
VSNSESVELANKIKSNHRDHRTDSSPAFTPELSSPENGKETGGSKVIENATSSLKKPHGLKLREIREWGVFIFTGLLVATTMFYTYFAARQFKTMNQQAEVMSKQAEVMTRQLEAMNKSIEQTQELVDSARRNFELAQVQTTFQSEPSLLITSLRFTEPVNLGNKITMVVGVRNVGKTSAYHINFNAIIDFREDLGIASFRFPAISRYRSSPTGLIPSDLFLPPGTEKEAMVSTDIRVPADILNKIKNEVSIGARIIIGYSDVAGRDLNRWFCRLYSPSKNTMTDCANEAWN